MSTLASTAPGVQLTFSFEGLTDKDQTLFKSFVRLLNHRTHQTWTHQANGADVRVVADKHPAAGTEATAPTLVLGAGAASHKYHVSLPIHADALELALNQIGHGILDHRRGRPAAPAGIVPGDRIRLARWPSAALLNSRERLRLATLMTGRPMSLAEMKERSGVAEAVCSDFMSALEQAGVLLHDAPHDTVPSALEPAARTAARASGGLLARIRSRLGLGAGSRQ